MATSDKPSAVDTTKPDDKAPAALTAPAGVDAGDHAAALASEDRAVTAAEDKGVTAPAKDDKKGGKTTAYTVIHPVIHDATAYTRGEQITLPTDVAADLLAARVITDASGKDAQAVIDSHARAQAANIAEAHGAPA